MDVIVTHEGWRQIQAGASLVTWSRLAHWDASALCFAPAKSDAFESDHTNVHSRYGRLICWITFAVGVEYLCKGVCLLKGLPVFGKTKSVIRPPQAGENLEHWIDLVNQTKDGASVVQQQERRTKTLTQMVDQVRQMEDLGTNRDLVTAALKLLAITIRNRDAHRYTENVRSFHFNVVPDLVVPSLNALLGTLDTAEMVRHLSEVGEK